MPSEGDSWCKLSEKAVGAFEESSDRYEAPQDVRTVPKLREPSNRDSVSQEIPIPMGFTDDPLLAEPDTAMFRPPALRCQPTPHKSSKNVSQANDLRLPQVDEEAEVQEEEKEDPERAQEVDQQSASEDSANEEELAVNQAVPDLPENELNLEPPQEVPVVLFDAPVPI